MHCSAHQHIPSRRGHSAAHLADADVELLELDALLELAGAVLDADAAVKTWPAKLVVKPLLVASVIAGPPTEVTSTTGTPFAVTIVAYAALVSVPSALVAASNTLVAVASASADSTTEDAACTAEPTKDVAWSKTEPTSDVRSSNTAGRISGCGARDFTKRMYDRARVRRARQQGEQGRGGQSWRRTSWRIYLLL